MGFFSRAKDAALEHAILQMAKSKLERYGQLQHFSLDSQNKTFSAEVLLFGEPEPVRVPEGHYRIEEENGQVYIVLHGIRISREWAQRALDDHMPEVRFKAPGFLRSLL